MEECRIIKVLNNNVILVDSESIQYILVGKGIGFGKKSGEIIKDFSGIESKFISLQGLDINASLQFTNNLDPKIAELTKDILKIISEEFNRPLNPNVHVNLIDHIQFTVKRLKSGMILENPFLNETKLLYPKEYAVAEKAVEILSKGLNMHFPDAEIGFITLHICGGLNEKSKKDALENAQLINTILNFVSKKLNVTLDPNSFEYKGFVNHLRGVLNRIKNNKILKNNLLTELKKRNIIEYKIAYDVSKIIENVLQISVPEDEIGYITIHIMKLNSIVNC